MSLRNSTDHYGRLARLFHWLTAALILVAWPLGWYAAGLPYDNDVALAHKAQLFSIHKTLGVLAFFTALLRVIWALTQVHPGPLHPERRLENWMAAMVHYALYAAILLVPLTGWIHHAATEGFAPILLGFGDNLPFVPKSESLARIFGIAHVLSNFAVFGLVLLHVGGALKHLLIDRDGTLGRMLWGQRGGRAADTPKGARAVAALIWVLVGAAVWAGWQSTNVPQAAPRAAVTAPAGANWQVEEGTLAIRVRQMGAEVSGAFEDWQAAITFDPEATSGNRVEVRIATGSLRLGTVSAQATGPDFLNAAAAPEAVYQAEIHRDGAAWRAVGTLTLNGATLPVELPFTLTLDGDRARMEGEAALDRRDFGIGKTFGDEATVGFAVGIAVNLTARRL